MIYFWVCLGLLLIKNSDPIKVSRSLLYLICISVAISSQEAGRYPAYKEMVAEYRWLNKCMSLVLFLVCQHHCFIIVTAAILWFVQIHLWVCIILKFKWCVFFLQWLMALSSLPPRVQNPTLQLPPCRLGLQSALSAAFLRSCSLQACHLTQTWWTSASPLRTRGRGPHVYFNFLQIHLSKYQKDLNKIIHHFTSTY